MHAPTSPLAVVAGLAIAAGVLVPLELVAVPAANAYWNCETAAPYSEYVDTSMEFVYSAAGATGAAVEIAVPEMCISLTSTVTELSNADGVTVDIVADGTGASAITLTPPAPDFAGIARVDLEVVDGTTSYVLELYGLFGVAPTSYSFTRPDPVSTAVGASAHFPISGIVLRSGAVIRAEVLRSTQPVTVAWVDSPSGGILVTPAASYRGVIGVRVLITDGITSSQRTVYQWAGLPIPTTAVWAPNPPPVAIEPGGTGYFDLSSSFVPYPYECELKVTTEPDVTISTEPLGLNGVSFGPVPIDVIDASYVGLLTVKYRVSCRLPDLSVSSEEWNLVLYVGVPIPELAETGPTVDIVPLGAGALAAMLGGFVLLRRRVIRTARSR